MRDFFNEWGEVLAHVLTAIMWIIIGIVYYANK